MFQFGSAKSFACFSSWMEWNASWWKYKYSRNWRIQAFFIISRGKMNTLECYWLQPLSSPPWRRVTAFSKCLVFSADKERLVGSPWELFACCCCGILGKICSSVLVSAMKQLSKDLCLSAMFLFTNKQIGTKNYLACASSSHVKVHLWGPFSSPYPVWFFLLGGKLGCKKVALKFEYSNWSWI